ncbi:unnamed protein product [Rotaria magnacalcarata]|uniref:Uncharacterized protein n=2 Tax=Rotaria magnacalcarata TaxID=392030 RepID=A0A816GN70_9BILA|nr:unnamed protein product [Rotaria magnacalcarata]CAF1677519.1 unnamed protein product [Rotaria magnacalcarata]CAF2048595.1 unnamed protein product [Rotaria magnacalcarata]CAF3930986.1 unnamed protein product [Rotaria magnacalcarata]CAF4079286.1 unnamed protein product [Rotaria magnacalcarata]
MSSASVTKKANKKSKGEINESDQRPQQSQELSESVLQLQDDEEFPPLAKLPTIKTAPKSHHPVENKTTYVPKQETTGKKIDLTLYPRRVLFKSYKLAHQ